MGALWRLGYREHGAARSYLQVETDERRGDRLYAGLGYWTHHDYRYRIDPAHMAS